MEAPDDSDSNGSPRVCHKKKPKTVVLAFLKHQGKNTHKCKYSQYYWVLCKKPGINERKYKPHTSEIAFELAPTRTPSRKACEEARETGTTQLSSSRSMKRSGRGI